MMKVRLYKGPFNGKVYETDGRNDIIVTGKKPMTRQQKFEWTRDFYSAVAPRPFPQVQAHYRIVMRTIPTATGVAYAPAVHPDGSVFYEYVPGSKQEY